MSKSKNNSIVLKLTVRNNLSNNNFTSLSPYNRLQLHSLLYESYLDDYIIIRRFYALY